MQRNWTITNTFRLAKTEKNLVADSLLGIWLQLLTAFNIFLLFAGQIQAEKDLNSFNW